MMRNTTFQDNKTLAQALEELRLRLPASWSVDVVDACVQVPGPDAVVRIVGSDGRSAMLVVEVRTRLDPKDVEPFVSRSEMRSWRGTEATPLIAARFLGERTRDRLRSLGAGYIDLTGSLYLRLDSPAVAIERAGASKDPEPLQRPARSLKGAMAGRVVRTLADFPTPLGTREIARIAQVDPGYVSRLLSMLELEDLVDRQPRGPVTRINWQELLRAWALDYSLMTSNATLSCLQPRGLPQLLEALRRESATQGMRYAISGSLAAARRAPIAPARLAVVYVERSDRATELLGLVPTETGANVLLAEPFNEVVFERTVLDDGLRYVAPAQAVADLLSSPGRGPQEADALIDWMLANEEAWRDR